MRLRGLLCGLGAAALFGASAPFAKRLLADLGPFFLAALLYLGAGFAITLARLVPHRGGVPREAPLLPSDLRPLILIVVLGGIVGPVLMMVGLGRLPGIGGSLLLNLEAPFTVLFAVTLFREHLGRRELVAAGVILLGAMAMSVGPGDRRMEALGALCLAGACAAWGLDNNLSQRLSGKDPLAVVQVKTLSAGAGTLTLALALGETRWLLGPCTSALALGAASYGLSLVLDMYALRLLGAAREAAIFATAPFIGAALSVPILGERPRMAHAFTAVAVAAGVVLLIRARHRHSHTHEAIEHDHMHVHDAHHQHPHDEPVTGPHAHPHRHAPLTHDHPHVSDVHHRHRHAYRDKRRD